MSGLRSQRAGAGPDDELGRELLHDVVVGAGLDRVLNRQPAAELRRLHQGGHLPHVTRIQVWTPSKSGSRIQTACAARRGGVALPFLGRGCRRSGTTRWRRPARPRAAPCPCRWRWGAAAAARRSFSPPVASVRVSRFDCPRGCQLSLRLSISSAPQLVTGRP